MTIVEVVGCAADRADFLDARIDEAQRRIAGERALAFPVIAIRGMFHWLQNATKSDSSEVSPEFDSASTMSLVVKRAEVAMARFAGMHEMRRLADRRESRCNLAGNVTRLANAGYHNSSVDRSEAGARRARYHRKFDWQRAR